MIVDNLDDPVENQFENEIPQQPDWMELIKPNPNYEKIDECNFKYDDGGPEYDWGLTSHHYPSDLGINWLNNKGNNKITELRTILQRENRNS